MASTSAFPDLIQPFRIEGAAIIGRLVRLGEAFADTIEPHDYPAIVAELLGETEALSVALAGSLKYDGIFTLQAQGDGPVGMLVADVTSDGAVRAYARVGDENAPTLSDGTAIDSPVPHLIGNGHLAFTVDQGPDTDRYQGITPLEGATLADCAHLYFRQSEQLETAIKLAAVVDETGSHAGPRAAAFMIQRLPGEKPADIPDEDAEERWRRAVILMSSLKTSEMLDPDLSPRDLLFRLYHEDGVRMYDSRPLRFECRCSRKKVADVLSRFAPENLADMKTDEGVLVATCEFCRAEYRFDDDDLVTLNELRKKSNSTS